MEEEKVPNMSRTRVGDMDGGGSLEHHGSNYDQASLDEEVYGGAVGDPGAGGMGFADEAFKAPSRNVRHARENSFQEIAGLGDGGGGGQAPPPGYPATGPGQGPFDASRGSREDVG
jgi:hypothetical protein